MKNVRDVDALVDATVHLANKVPCVIKEVIPKLAQEKIVPNDAFRVPRAAAGAAPKLDINFLQELGDRVEYWYSSSWTTLTTSRIACRTRQLTGGAAGRPRRETTAETAK